MISVHSPVTPKADTASIIEWTCIEWGDSYLKLRKNGDGDTECGGLTQNSCTIDASTQQECENVVPTTTLTCGPEHTRIYGYSGYDREGHWCNTDLSTSRDGFVFASYQRKVNTAVFKI